MGHKWTYLLNRNKLMGIENKLLFVKIGKWEQDWEFVINRCKLLYIGWVDDRSFLNILW